MAKILWGVTKLRITRLSRWALNAIRSIVKREAEIVYTEEKAKCQQRQRLE